MLAENFSVYTDPAGLGDTATVGTGSIDGIFQREWAEINNVEGYYPTFLVADTDAASISVESTALTIASVAYKAVSKRQDGTGMTLLVLRKS